MASNKDQGKPWIGYGGEVKKRLEEALGGGGDAYKNSIARFLCTTRGIGKIKKKDLVELINRVTGRGCKTTLYEWLNDPEQVPGDMAEVLSRLLGFDDAEHVRTGLSQDARNHDAYQYNRTSDFLKEANGYLLMIGRASESLKKHALEYLRDLAMALNHDGDEHGEALESIARGMAFDALDKRAASRAMLERQHEPYMPLEWYAELDHLENVARDRRESLRRGYLTW